MAVNRKTDAADYRCRTARSGFQQKIGSSALKTPCYCLDMIPSVQANLGGHWWPAAQGTPELVCGGAGGRDDGHARNWIEDKKVAARDALQQRVATFMANDPGVLRSAFAAKLHRQITLAHAKASQDVLHPEKED